MVTREEILGHVQKTYNIVPDYPWARTPNYAILRHQNHRKWFGAIIDITPDKLGLEGDHLVDVLNVKCDPLLIGGIRDGVEIFPAYHMNKEHWITVLLSGTVSKERVCQLLDISYRLTR